GALRRLLRTTRLSSRRWPRGPRSGSRAPWRRRTLPPGRLRPSALVAGRLLRRRGSSPVLRGTARLRMPSGAA
ncbi:hypothetical protein, partial [Saccharopolyspora rectivirgula]|uniref:hypothetical protein n=1 Tax=Saccharopolyspora rectivirgula TaxID=28042 RepID=UPI002409D3CE